MNSDLERLQPYPFQRLSQLLNHQPLDPSTIALTIGEPKHATPSFITEALLTHLHTLSNYPATKGITTLREAISSWLIQRFKLPTDSLDPERHVLPVTGTREALFALAQAVIDRNQGARVAMPNPFYQIYEGAALLAGAEPYYINCMAENNFLPDLDAIPATVWEKCQLLYLCSPANPTGAVMDQAALQRAIELADQYDFIIASDECYSELYLDEDQPPYGLLQAAAELGRTDYQRCLVFHSLSKRSNAPGMRSGFVAGDAKILERFLLYRTYHGCAMPPAHQHASIAAWSDEQHVIENRALYREKFARVHQILQPVLDYQLPEAGFYLWPKTPIADTAFALQLYQQHKVLTLPGSYLSRAANGSNPGSQRIRMALVAPLDECERAAQKIRTFIETL